MDIKSPSISILVFRITVLSKDMVFNIWYSMPFFLWQKELAVCPLSPNSLLILLKKTIIAYQGFYDEDLSLQNRMLYGCSPTRKLARYFTTMWSIETKFLLVFCRNSGKGFMKKISVYRTDCECCVVAVPLENLQDTSQLWV